MFGIYSSFSDWSPYENMYRHTSGNAKLPKFGGFTIYTAYEIQVWKPHTWYCIHRLVEKFLYS